MTKGKLCFSRELSEEEKGRSLRDLTMPIHIIQTSWRGRYHHPDKSPKADSIDYVMENGARVETNTDEGIMTTTLTSDRDRLPERLVKEIAQEYGIRIN